MQTITTIGLDIAKSVFQVHGVGADGNVVLRRQLKRRYVLAFFQKLPQCLVGIEACASSHHWSRELQALGHTVRLSGLQSDVASRLLPEVALHPQQPVARAQVSCESTTRLAKLAGDSGKEDAEWVLRHMAGVPSLMTLPGAVF